MPRQPTLCPHGVLGVEKCKDCSRERNRRWRERDPEAYRESRRRWAANNADKVREKNRRYKAENTDKNRDQQRRLRAADPERFREYERRWRRENPDRARDTTSMHQTRRRLQPGAAFDKTVTPTAVFERLGRTCSYCGIQTIERNGINYLHPHYPTIDHKVPLSKGGGHTWGNVVVACLGCNTEKRDDVCAACGGAIANIGEKLCAKCANKEQVTVWSCGHIESGSGSWCSACKPEGYSTREAVVQGVSRREAERVLVEEVLDKMTVMDIDDVDDLRRLLEVRHS